MRILYDLINTKAILSWNKEQVTLYNFEDWRQHWIATAKELKRQFQYERLIETACEMERIIDFEERIKK